MDNNKQINSHNNDLFSEKENGSKVSSLLSKVHTFESFKNRDFRYYFFSMVGQWSSMNMQMVANSLLAYRITGSAAILGLVALANALPLMLLSLFGGVVADRMQKKTLLQIGQAATGITSLVIAFAIMIGYMSATHPESWWILLATSIFTGIVAAFTMPARQSIIPELVGRNELMNAVSLNTMGMNIFRLASPAIAGFIIDGISFEAVYFIMAGLFFMGMVFTSFLPRTSIVQTNNNTLTDIKEGLKYMQRRHNILFLLIYGFVFVVLFMPFQNLLPLFTEDILRVGATGQGILMSVSGAGALTASIISASLPGKRRGIIHIIATLTVGLALAVFAFSTNWFLSLALMAFIGMGQTWHVTTGTTMLQTFTEPQYLGRVMSILMMNWGLSGLGTFFGGVLADSIGAQWAIGGLALLLSMISVFALIFVPTIRKID